MTIDLYVVVKRPAVPVAAHLARGPLDASDFDEDWQNDIDHAASDTLNIEKDMLVELAEAGSSTPVFPVQPHRARVSPEYQCEVFAGGILADYRDHVKDVCHCRSTPNGECREALERLCVYFNTESIRSHASGVIYGQATARDIIESARRVFEYSSMCWAACCEGGRKTLASGHSLETLRTDLELVMEVYGIAYAGSFIVLSVSGC